MVTMNQKELGTRHKNVYIEKLLACMQLQRHSGFQYLWTNIFHFLIVKIVFRLQLLKIFQSKIFSKAINHVKHFQCGIVKIWQSKYVKPECHGVGSRPFTETACAQTENSTYVSYALPFQNGDLFHSYIYIKHTCQKSDTSAALTFFAEE